MQSIDISDVRADTPGCEHVIHFSNAGSSLPTSQALEAQIDYLRLEASIGGYEAMAEAAPNLDNFYSAAGALLNCSPHEVSFVSGASEAWWRAFLAVDLKPGDRVLVGSTEFQSAAFGLMQARNRGVVVDVIPNTRTGQVDISALESMLDGSVKLVGLTQIAMSNGLVNPAAQVGAIVAQSDALYLLDACQAVGQMPVDVEDIKCDFLTATGRKWMRGPRGTGMLYVRDSIVGDLMDPVFVDGRSALWDSTNTYRPLAGSARFELGEANHSGKVGLGVAIDYALRLGLGAIADRVGSLADQMRIQLKMVPDVTVTDIGPDLCGIVTFTTEALPASEVSHELRQRGINTSSLGASNSRWMFESMGVDEIVRASPHYYNTEEEVDVFVRALREVLEGAG
jgi:cysteine desulfurase/selenocysteine lyase